MGRKIIITESQLERLKINIQEGELHSKMVAMIKQELDKNYIPITGVKRKGGEYIETPMIKIKVDGENITPKALYDYLMYKYKMGEEFMKQVIRDWIFGNITDDHRLSRNVALTENSDTIE